MSWPVRYDAATVSHNLCLRVLLEVDRLLLVSETNC